MLSLKFLDYRVTNDQNQFVLSKVRKTESGQISINKDGNENLNVMGYYDLTKPKLVLRAIENDLIFNGQEELTSLKEVRARCIEVVSLLEEINERLIDNVGSH
ncbi:hypothetical protein [Enterococcus italicus]|uniref:hypothetical protein n=1 Tax=Enterococcus italicus TaxID=246144 RepID=UPI00207420B6|nr:hypothetical protein [Enterococcus italicus]